MFSSIVCADGEKLGAVDLQDNPLISSQSFPIGGMIGMNPLTSMTVFVEVARRGGFSAAARSLHLSTTAASRHVGELERMLGVTLLRRTTRQVSLTEAGSRYLPRAAAILEEIERLHDEISATDAAPSGKLRVTAPPALGHDWIAPLAVEFAERHPAIQLEMEFTERVVDLVAEGFDAAIRAGPLPDSSMIAHRILEIRYVLCASRRYLEERGRPERPEDLPKHECIHWRGSADGETWIFLKDDRRVAVPIRARLLISNFAAEREAALRDLGLAILPLLDVRDDLEAGRLEHVLPGWEVPPGQLSLLRPPTAFEPPKLRAFNDFITHRLRERTRPSD